MHTLRGSSSPISQLCNVATYANVLTNKYTFNRVKRKHQDFCTIDRSKVRIIVPSSQFQVDWRGETIFPWSLHPHFDQHVFILASNYDLNMRNRQNVFITSSTAASTVA